MNAPLPPPGWHLDTDGARYRYWDGQGWTDQYAPLEGSPEPAPPSPGTPAPAPTPAEDPGAGSGPTDPPSGPGNDRAKSYAYGLFVCGLVYVAGLLTLGSHTETFNKERFREVFSDNVVNSSVFEAINGHFVAVGHALGMDDEALEGEHTPSGWVRVETKRYSYAVPKDWSTESREDFDTYARESPSGYGIFGERVPRDGASLSKVARGAKSELKSAGAKDSLELDPFSVATYGDPAESGQALASVYATGQAVYYVAVIAVGRDEALIFTIASSSHDQLAMRRFCDKVMDTFVVQD